MNQSIEPLDPLYQRAMRFAKNKIAGAHGGLSNVYVIQKTNLDGDVVGEYYGMNLMTDFGMSQYFVTNASFPTKIYIGNGTGTFNHTTNTLISPIVTTGSTLSDGTKSYNYPLYYDSISGLITCMSKFITAYFDYNIAGITDTISITEYGLGSAWNAMWTHSWVYDIAGSQTYVTKAVNERLTITVYLCYSYYESLITNGHTNGVYSVITTMERFFNNRMYEDYTYTFKKDSSKTSRSVTRTSSGFMNNLLTRYTNLTTFLLNPGTTDDAGYMDGFCQYTNGFLSVERQVLDTPEAFDRTQQFITFDDEGLAKAFGDKNQNLQFTQADVSSVALFNRDTAAWDNAESFVNDASKWYNESTMGLTFQCPIRYTNNNTIMLMYVYQNLSINDPILALNNAGLSTVYVTDKYWDTSSWVLLTDQTSIPQSLQNKRYWITPNFTIPLNPVRSKKGLLLNPPGGRMTMTEWSASIAPTNRGHATTCGAGWYAISNIIYIPETHNHFAVGANGYRFDISWIGLPNHALLFTTTPQVVDVNLTTLANPVQNSITPNFSTATTSVLNNCYRTSNGTNRICMQSLNINESVIMDFSGATCVQEVILSKNACMIYGTNRMAYHDATNTSNICIYDTDAHGVIATFTIPSGWSTIPFMFGLKNHVWISNGSTTYLITIDTQTITECATAITINSNLYTIEMTAIDDVAVVYKNNATLADAWCVTTAAPTQPIKLTNFGSGTDGIYVEYPCCYLHSVLDHSLGLVVVGSTNKGYERSAVFDMGQFLCNGVVRYQTEYVTDQPSYGVYGDRIIRNLIYNVPMEYWFQHRLIGTTNTITSINHTKSISNKQWSVSVTNIPEFSGRPPGSIQ